jgi:hypothetical protein
MAGPLIVNAIADAETAAGKSGADLYTLPLAGASRAQPAATTERSRRMRTDIAGSRGTAACAMALWVIVSGGLLHGVVNTFARGSSTCSAAEPPRSPRAPPQPGARARLRPRPADCGIGPDLGRMSDREHAPPSLPFRVSVEPTAANGVAAPAAGQGKGHIMGWTR